MVAEFWRILLPLANPCPRELTGDTKARIGFTTKQVSMAMNSASIWHELAEHVLSGHKDAVNSVATLELLMMIAA
jgi:hypothetical protein